MIQRFVLGGAVAIALGVAFPAIAMSFERLALGVGSGERDADTALFGLLAELAVPCGFFGRRSLGNPPRGATGEIRRPAQVRCRQNSLFESFAFELRHAASPVLLGHPSLLGSPAIARRELGLLGLLTQRYRALIDGSLAHTAQDFERIAPPHLPTLTRSHPWTQSYCPSLAQASPKSWGKRGNTQ